MATQTSLATIWQGPDEVWSLIAPLLGPEKARGTPGRPAVPLRRIFDGSLYGVRPGCQWSALPRHDSAPTSTVWGRFQPWAAAGFSNDFLGSIRSHARERAAGNLYHQHTAILHSNRTCRELQPRGYLSHLWHPFASFTPYVVGLRLLQTCGQRSAPGERAQALA
jgi:transposase